MNRRPNSGEIYRHFKDKMYQIITIARHSETGEELVIYQALYGDYKCCARPLEMFVSEVDHEKYPEAKQKYRFEKVEIVAENQRESVCQQADDHMVKDSKVIKDGNIMKDSYAIKDSNIMEDSYAIKDSNAIKDGTTIKENNTIKNSKFESLNRNVNVVKNDEIKNMTAEEKMMAFFDTDDLEKRYKILSSLHDEITHTMIDNMAVVMDVIIEDGSLTKRYDDLKHAIQTKQRYEQTARLR